VRHPDRLAFQGILFVLHTGIAWEYLPQELGFGPGMTCRRRLAEQRLPSAVDGKRKGKEIPLLATLNL
jgi:hypothetical protein